MKIDSVKISEKINSILDNYLDDVNKDDFRFISEDIRTFVHEVAEKIINENYDYYYGALTSLDDKLALGDVNRGYKAQIQEFIDKNSIELSYTSFNVEDVKMDVPIPRESIYIAAGGTIVAVALCFASNIWIALVAEIIALSIAYKIYSDTRKRAEAIKAEQMLIDKKLALANQIEADVTNWLNELLKESDRIISSFHFEL